MNDYGTSKPAVTFTELLRRAQAEESSTFYQYCDLCACERPFKLQAETDTQEYYCCDSCGMQKAYRVR